MIFGILSSQNCMLLEISRDLNKKITLKNIIDRFSQNLKKFNQAENFFENYLHTIKAQINKSTTRIVDESDITKNYITKAEWIVTVRNGSTGEYKFGCHKIEVIVLNVYTSVYKSFFRQGKRVCQ